MTGEHPPSSKKRTPFNVNNYVWVRLTDHGRKILREQHEALFERSRNPPEWSAPKEQDGWSRWQLWDLMTQLGDYCYNGGQVPFETTIEVEFPVETCKQEAVVYLPCERHRQRTYTMTITGPTVPIPAVCPGCEEEKRSALKASCQHDRFKPGFTPQWLGSTPDVRVNTHRFLCRVCNETFDLAIGEAQLAGLTQNGKSEPGKP